jgi:hypothetical protein
VSLLNTRRVISAASLPESRITDTPPVPRGEDIAAIVSVIAKILFSVEGEMQI